jgi:hypothetical protein
MLEHLEPRALLAAAFAPDVPPGGGATESELIEPMAARKPEPAKLTAFALMDASEVQLRTFATGDTIDLKYYRDLGITSFKVQAVTGGKISSVYIREIGPDATRSKTENSAPYTLSTAPLPVGVYEYFGEAFGTDGSKASLTVSGVQIIDSGAEQPPEPPPTVKVTGISLTRNGAAAGSLTNNSTYTPEQLTGTRAVAQLEGTTSKVTFLLAGPIVKGPVEEFNAPYDTGIPPLTDGFYQLAVTPDGGASLTVAFEVKAVIDPPDGGGGDGGGGDVDVIVRTATVGEVVNVRLSDSQLIPGAEQANWAWSWGDGSKWANVTGFNAAHVFEQPGEYVLRLNGTPLAKYAVAARTDSPTVVSSGSQLAQAISAGKTWIRLEGTAVLTSTISVSRKVFIEGMAGAAIHWNVYSDRAMFTGSGSLVVKNVTFDSLQASQFGKEGAATALHMAGSNHALIGCTFLRMGNAFNGDQDPAGVLFQDCTALMPTGIRGYLAWVEGSDWCFYGVNALNSTREHIIRVGGGTRIAVVGCDLENLDRRPADPGDIAKSTLNFQVGSWGWADNNKLRGPIGIGPLGGTDGLRDYGTEARWKFATIRNSTLDECLIIEDGSEHILIDNNTMSGTDLGQHHGAALKFTPPERDLGFTRVQRNVRITNNVITSPYQHSMLVWMQEQTAELLVFEGNTFKYGTTPNPSGWMSRYRPLWIERGGVPAHYAFTNNSFPVKSYGWPNSSAECMWIQGAAEGTGAEANYRTLAQLNAAGGSSGNVLA